MGNLGSRIIQNYDNSTNQEPGGDCFEVAYNRVNEACTQVCGTGLPSLSAFRQFDRLWAIKNDPRNTWLAYPENYRGKGSAGAMTSIGQGTLVDEDQIWEGTLEPGAVIQTWLNPSGYTDARDGVRNGELGHSFIFREYVRNNANQIIAMKIADQGTRWSRMPNGVPRDQFGYWVGANVNCATRLLTNSSDKDLSLLQRKLTLAPDLVVSSDLAVASMNARLTFDGYFLRWHEGSITEFNSFSGLADESARESVSDAGPTPQGLYAIEPSNIQNIHDVGLPPDAWGRWRVPLEPYRATVDRMRSCFGVIRTSMYIHGGTQLGTIGCIELNDDSEERDFFDRLRNYGRRIELEVRYTGTREARYEDPNCPYP